MKFENICELCKKYRQQKNISVDLLSRSTGVNVVTLYKFEHGDRKSVKTLMSYLNFFGGDLLSYIYDHWDTSEVTK